MRRKQGRLTLIASAMGVLALERTARLIVLFTTPTMLAQKPVRFGSRLRLGGIVQSGSLDRNDRLISFRIADTDGSVPVSYNRILPDLFREGQGVVTEGTLDPAGTFKADTVLAKHDENYMPREVADALKAQLPTSAS